MTRDRWLVVPRGMAVLLLALVGCGAGPGGGAELGSQGWYPAEAELSPDGKWVAFMGHDGGLTSRARLVLAGEEPVVLGPERGGARGFGWLPDGSGLLLGHSEELTSASPTEFTVVDLRGEVVWEVPVERELHATGRYAIRDDVAVFAAQEPGIFEEPGSLWTLDLATGDLVEVVVGDREWFLLDPVFVDDRRVAVAANPPFEHRRQGQEGWVGVVDLDTGEVDRVAEGKEVADAVADVAVADEGRYLLYTTVRPFRLWVVPTDGSVPARVLVEDFAESSLSVVDGGRTILAVGGTYQPNQIMRIDVPADAPWR